MINIFLVFISVFATWVVFSGFLNPFFLIAGLISSAIAVYFANKMKIIDYDRYPVYLRADAPFYLIWLLKEVFVSAIDVSIRVWQKKPDISPTLEFIPTSQTSDVAKALYANSITLTPGTVCINVVKDKLEVHALTKEGMKDLKMGNMDKRIQVAVE